MTESSGIRTAAAQTCLVLMFKSPARSKRRLATQLGAGANAVAAHLLACAAEDLAGWPGPARYSPAGDDDAAWLSDSALPVRPRISQPQGNLGERITGVNRTLSAAGQHRQLFIGSDCPGLSPDYLQRAATALRNHDVVLGPASDGGVVLMGIAGLWPDLAALPWSEPTLYRALRDTCADAGLATAILPTLDDVDSADDLPRVHASLATDRRPARRALRRCMDGALRSAAGPAR